MSFDSDLEISAIEGEVPDLAALRGKILEQLDRDGIHHDVYEDIVETFSKRRGHFRVHSAYLLQLMDVLAPMFSDFHFDARGLGEEFRHTWVAEYRDGRRVFTQGPWDYD
jgi:hypothetical protein